jgi:hypothetical protein
MRMTNTSPQPKPSGRLSRTVPMTTLLDPVQEIDPYAQERARNATSNRISA